ncbi:MAG TPA: hypothetical protein VFF04_02225 [Candidatus Babeliales bacterium]|nr:hypothetical protein [Candidatus Babeliales bacterium]
MSAWSFCNEFYYCYDLELDSSTLTPLESALFSKLSTVSNRFSPYKEDHGRHPRLYSTEVELKELVIEIKKQLKMKFDEFQEEIKEREFYQI